MSRARPYQQKAPKEKSRPALELLDEAFHRLRTAPLALLGIYYAGSLPFILALLYFWADLSHRADAERYGAGASLGLAIMFLWMKACHAVFAARLRTLFNRRAARPWSARRLLDLFLVQSVLQSVGLFVLLVASVLTLPFGWAYAFCQSATAVGTGGDEGSVWQAARRSLRAAVLWPRQNHTMLLILTPLGLFVWLNILSAVIGVPHLLKLITGEENVFTRGGVDYFNSTFVMVTLSLAYLLLDPVVKTFYALRCFYADSQLSGEDLRGELRALPGPQTGVTGPRAGGGPDWNPPAPTRRPLAAAPLLAALLWLLGAGVAHAGLTPAGASSPAPAAARGGATPASAVAAAPSNTLPTNGGVPIAGSDPRIHPPDLDKSIEEVLHRREFAWRVPPKHTDAAVASRATGFFESAFRWTKDTLSWIGHQLARGARAVWRWWRAIKKWLFHDDDSVAPEPSEGGFNGDHVFLQRLIYVLIAVIVLVLAFQLWRTWRRRATPELAGQAADAGTLAAPDLHDEQVLASQLPEDEWLQLARRLVDSGEHRLAVRAFYLSILALLGTRGLLAIARHKSNRDYLTELRRRARDLAPLQAAFSRNVQRYERVWYGPHPANADLFDQFLADRQIIHDATAPPASAPPVPA